MRILGDVCERYQGGLEPRRHGSYRQVSDRDEQIEHTRKSAKAFSWASTTSHNGSEPTNRAGNRNYRPKAVTNPQPLVSS